MERGCGRVGCYAHLQWDAAPSRSGAGARTASEKRPSARNGSLLPPIKGAAAADSGADNPVRLLPPFLTARQSASLSRFGGKATRNFWCRAGPVGRGFAGRGQGPRCRCPPVRTKVSRFRGERVRRRTVAHGLSPTLAPPSPVKTTGVWVARLRLTAVRLPAKPVLEPNQGVLVKPNFESLNRAVFAVVPSVLL